MRKGKQVRLGVEAPQETTIFREEIYQKIRAENRLAAQLDFSRLDQLTNQDNHVICSARR